MAPNAHLQKLDVGIDYYFSNLHFGTFSWLSWPCIKKHYFLLQSCPPFPKSVKVTGATYYLRTLRDSVSPVCGTLLSFRNV